MLIINALLLFGVLVWAHEIVMPKSTIIMLTKERTHIRPYHYWDDLDIFLG